MSSVKFQVDFNCHSSRKMMSSHDIEKVVTVKRFEKMVRNVISKIDPSILVKVVLHLGAIEYVDDVVIHKYHLKSFKPISEMSEEYRSFLKKGLHPNRMNFRLSIREVVEQDFENRKNEICGFDVQEVEDMYDIVCKQDADCESMAQDAIDWLCTSQIIDLGEYEDPLVVESVMKKVRKNKAGEYLHSFYSLYD